MSFILLPLGLPAFGGGLEMLGLLGKTALAEPRGATDEATAAVDDAAGATVALGAGVPLAIEGVPSGRTWALVEGEGKAPRSVARAEPLDAGPVERKPSTE